MAAMTQDDLAWAKAHLAAAAGEPVHDPALTALAFAITDRGAGIAPNRDDESGLAACREALDRLKSAARAFPAANSADAARAALAGLIADSEGYVGDSERYEDPQNADMIRVMDRRRGLPVALGALYASLGEAAGFAVRGLSFPGHFLMRIDHGGGRAAFDPFGGGAAVEAQEMRGLVKAALGESAELKASHLEAVDHRRLLLRLRNNVKIRLLRDGRLPEAALVADGMAAFAPDDIELLREIGMIRARLGELNAARASLHRYLDLSTDDAGRRRARQLLDEIDHRLH